MEPLPRTAQFVNAVQRWGGFLPVSLAALIVVSTCFGILANHHPVLYQDHWDVVWIHQKLAAGKLGLADLWAQHNEHRIPLPNLFFLLDFSLFHGTGRVLVAIILLTQALHALLMFFLLRRIGTFSKDEIRFFSFASLIFFFWLSQRENFIWGFQIAWVLNGIFVSGAVYLICKTEENLGVRAIWINLSLAFLCCAAAAGSLANGLFISVISAFLLWRKALPVGYKFLWIAMSVALWGVYFLGYRPGSQNFGEHAPSILGVFRYFLAYLGSPVSAISLPLGMALGLAGLVMFLWLVARYLLEKNPSFLTNFCLAEMIFVMATAAVTAWGRNSFGVSQAASSRYHTPVLLFWFLLLLQIYVQINGYRKIAAVFRAGILLAVLCLVIPIQYVAAARALPFHYLKCDEAALEMRAEITGGTALKYIHPDASVVLELSRYLRENRLSVYLDTLWRLALGQPVPSDGSESRVEPHWRATIKELKAIGDTATGGYFIRGRVNPSPGIGLPRALFILQGGILVGFANAAKRPCLGCFTGSIKGLGNRDFELFGLESGTAEMHAIGITE